MKKEKGKFNYRKRPYLSRLNEPYNLETGQLVYPDGDDDEDYRFNQNLNREEIEGQTKKNQLR